MTRIEKVIKEVSDLRDFYLKIQKRKQSGSSTYSQKPLDPDATAAYVNEARTSRKDSNKVK